MITNIIKQNLLDQRTKWCVTELSNPIQSNLKTVWYSASNCHIVIVKHAELSSAGLADAVRLYEW